MASGSVAKCTVLLLCGSFNPITNMHLRLLERAKDHLQRLCNCTVLGGIISPVADTYGKKGLASAEHRCNMIKLAVNSSAWIKLDTWECSQKEWSRTALVLRHHQELLKPQVTAGSDSQADSPQLGTKRKKRRYSKTFETSESKTGAAQTASGADLTAPSRSPSNISQLNSEHVIARHADLATKAAGPIELRLVCGSDLLESFNVPGLWSDEDVEEIVSQYGLVVINRADTNPERFIYEHDVLSKHKANIELITEWFTNDISATKIRRAVRRAESVKYLLQDSVIDYIREHNLYLQPT